VREGVVKDATGNEDVFMASIFDGVASLNSRPLNGNGVLSTSTAAESTPLGTLASQSTLTPAAHLQSLSPASVRFDLAKSTFLERTSAQTSRIATREREPPRELVSSTSLAATVMSPASSVPFAARERDLEIRAMERQGRFGSLEFSWLIKNCFAAWRTLIHVKANLVIQRDAVSDFNMTLSELSVIKELQIALAEKDELILELEAQSEKLSRDLVACEAELKVELSEMDKQHTSRVLDLQSEHSLTVQDWNLRVQDAQGEGERRLREARREAGEERLRLEEEWRLRLREREDEHEQRLRDAQAQRHRLEEELETRLREADEAQIQLREEHRLHLLRLEREHADKLRDAHGQRTRLEGEFELRLQEVGEEHSRIKEHHSSHINRLEQDHGQQLRQVQEKLQERIRELEVGMRDSADQAAEERRLLEDEWRGRTREAEDAHTRLQRELSKRNQQLEEEWSGRLRDAEDTHARLREEHSLQMRKLREEHGLHLSKFEKEHGLVIRNAEETRMRLESEWKLRLQRTHEERDLHLREMEEKHAAHLKQCMSKAAMGFLQGMGSSKERALKAMVLHAWVRAASIGQLEKDYERRLNHAEELRARLEERWDSTLQQADSERQQLEWQWNARLREADDELHRAQRDAEQAISNCANKRDKAALILFPTKFKGIVFAGWARAVHRLVLQRELEMRLREAEEHKAQLQWEHQQQLRKVDAQRLGLQREHDLQVQQLAEDESRRLRNVELEFARIQDELDVRIRSHEDEKMRLLKEHDDERERLQKEAMALNLMHKDIMSSAADTYMSQHQERILLVQTFLTWSQHCTHERWRRNVDDMHYRHREHSSHLRSRKERSVERLALQGCVRMLLHQAIVAWWAASADACRGKSAAEREKALVQELRWRRSEAIMLVATQGQTRLLLVQVLLVWLHTAAREKLARRFGDAASQRDGLHRQRLKGWGHRWALLTMDASSTVLLQKLLSSWWLWAREASWGYHLSVYSASAARYKTSELLGRSILLMDRDHSAHLASVVFGVWKSRIPDEKSARYYRAQREKLLDRWGMQCGLTKGAVFWHRVFSSWLRFARAECERRQLSKRTRTHSLHVAEQFQRAVGGLSFAFYTWLGNTSHGRVRREADALASEIALIRLKYGKSFDRCSGVFTNLHSKAFAHMVLSSWCQYAHTIGWGRLLDKNGKAATYHRESRKVTNIRFAIKCWESDLRSQARLSLQAWRQLVLDIRHRYYEEYLSNIIQNLKRRAADRFRQRPVSFLGKAFMEWRHAVLESRGLVGQQRLRDIRRSLRQEMEDNDLFRTTFLIQGLFTRWKHWAVAIRHQTAMEALRRAALDQGMSARPGRVYTVVSAIEEQRARLSQWEAFMRWSYIVRIGRQDRMSGTQVREVIVRQAPPVVTTYLPPTVTRTVAPPVYLPATTTVVPSTATSTGWQTESTRHRRLQQVQHEGWRTRTSSPVETEILRRHALPTPPAVTTYSPRAVRSVVVPAAPTPLATVGLDVTQDGHADLLVTGADLPWSRPALARRCWAMNQETSAGEGGNGPHCR